MMNAKLAGFFLRLGGWTAAEPVAPEEKCVILGVPHTSIMDFVWSYFYYASVGGEARCMVKKEFFWGPLGWLLRKMGCIPVDRKNSTSLILSVVREFEKADHLHLCLAPEGTRKRISKWKHGYHLIATKANVPVYLGYFDYKRKRVGRGQKFELTGDAKADTERIQEIYESMDLGARYPENYTTK